MTELLTTLQVAELLGISRIAVFKKIKSGEIKARKIGRNYVIDRNDIGEIFEDVIPAQRKKEIEKAVKKTVTEYGEALRQLKDE